MTDYFDNGKEEQHIFVLHGLGGGGKTQTALKFINQCQRKRPDRRWDTPFFLKFLSMFMYYFRFSKVASSRMHIG